MSASWGPADVTDKVRDIYQSQARAGNTNFTLTPTIGLLGDPILHSIKAFVMVWRLALGPDDQSSEIFSIHSTPQTYRIFEGNVMTLNYSQCSIPYVPQASPPNSLIIFSASYDNKDVTNTVFNQNIVPPLTVPINNTIFGPDPLPHNVKSCSITYAYVRDDGFLDYNMQTGMEGGGISIPRAPAPRLALVAWTSQITSEMR